MAHLYGSGVTLASTKKTAKKSRKKAAQAALTKAYGVPAAALSPTIAAVHASAEAEIAAVRRRVATTTDPVMNAAGERWLATNDPRAARRVEKAASREARELDDYLQRLAASGAHPNVVAYLALREVA